MHIRFWAITHSGPDCWVFRSFVHWRTIIRALCRWTAYWLELCRKVVKPGGVAAIFIDWRQLPALYDAIQWGGWVVRGLIPWDKKNARPQPHRPKQQCEFIVWASNGPLDVKRDAEYMPGLLQGLPPSAQVPVTG